MRNNKAPGSTSYPGSLLGLQDKFFYFCSKIAKTYASDSVASTGCVSVSLKSKLFLRPDVEDELPLERTFLGRLTTAHAAFSTGILL